MKKIINLFLLTLFANLVVAQILPVVPAENFKTTNLGPQVTDVMLQGSVFYKAPDGKLLIYTVTRGTPARLLAFNVDTRKLEVDLPLPKTDGSWDLEVSSTGIIYIAGGAGGNFYKHVPGSGTVEHLGKVLGTENYIWDLSAGENGEIYGATYPNCKVFKYHPDEGITDFGNGPLVQGQNYVRGLVYNHSSQKIFGGIGTHAHLIELDVKTKSKTNILPEKYSVAGKFVYDIGQVEGLKSGDRIYLTGAAPEVLVYNVTKKVFENKISNFAVKTIIKDPKSEKVYYVHGGTKLMMLDYAEGDNPMSKVVSTFSGKPLASTWNAKGELVFLSSQEEIFTFNPLTLEKKTYKLDVPAQAIGLTVISMGPDKKIWSGGYLSGNNAAYDLKSGKAEVFKGLSQTESLTKLGTKIYFGNYPGSRFNVYDITKEWNRKEKNPKQIGVVKGQDRPFGALAIPSLNKVFFGTVPNYGINGGELVEIDAVTDKLTKYADVAGKQSIITLAFQDDMLIGGSSIWGGLGIQPVEKAAKLFVWDPVKKEKVFETIPVPGAQTITALLKGPDGLVWGYAGGTLFKFDVKKKKVVLTKHIYDDKRSSFLWRPDMLLVHPNGMIYGNLIGKLISLNPETLEVKSFNTSGADLILGLDKEMYYRSGKEIWRLDILKK